MSDIRIYMGILRQSRAIVLLALALLTPALAIPAEGVSEHTLKAAVAHKITKFVSWPDSAPQPANAPLRFCVSGAGPIHDALAAMQDFSIQGRPLEVAVAAEPLSAAESCDVLYLADDAVDDPEAWLAAVADRPILTFAEAERYGDYRSIVTVGIRRNKVRFDINVDASQRAGLTIGAQLLQLAAMSNRRGR